MLLVVYDLFLFLFLFLFFVFRFEVFSIVIHHFRAIFELFI